MQKRICPNCGQPWYSAAENEIWLCSVCGAKVPPTCVVEISSQKNDCCRVLVPIKCIDRFLPQYQHHGDAGADLRASASAILMPGQVVVVPAGVKIAIPDGYAGLVLPRSGLSAKGIVVIPGTIDSGYRGEIGITIYNLACMDKFSINVGDRIAHLLLLSVVQADFVRVQELPTTGDRGENGFGSTGIS